MIQNVGYLKYKFSENVIKRMKTVKMRGIGDKIENMFEKQGGNRV